MKCMCKQQQGTSSAGYRPPLFQGPSPPYCCQSLEVEQGRGCGLSPPHIQAGRQLIQVRLTQRNRELGCEDGRKSDCMMGVGWAWVSHPWVQGMRECRGLARTIPATCQTLQAHHPPRHCPRHAPRHCTARFLKTGSCISNWFFRLLGSGMLAGKRVVSSNSTSTALFRAALSCEADRGDEAVASQSHSTCPGKRQKTTTSLAAQAHT